MAVGYPKIEVTGHPAYWYFGSSGVYTINPALIFAGAPVYQRTHGWFGWSLYRRDSAKWYLDFNAISDLWSGTVNYAHKPTHTPLEASWSKWRYSILPMRVRLPKSDKDAHRALQAPESVEEAGMEAAAMEAASGPTVPDGLPHELVDVEDEDDGDAALVDPTITPHTIPTP